jgi:hypothetical protein
VADILSYLTITTNRKPAEPEKGKFYNVVGQIGNPDCRGGDRRRKRERIEIERGRKSKKERRAPEGASRLKQVKMALQSVV